MLSKREVLKAGAAMALPALFPPWARASTAGNHGLASLSGTSFDLSIGRFPVRISGRTGHAVGVNGTVPAPLIRFREGDEITLRVTNNLDEDTSIHWHGLLVPFHMDGVPGVSFPGIEPGETFTYKFAVPQSGTYWYHSHSGLQEQSGHYGPLIIDPKGTDPVAYDREYVIVLSDWTFEHPHRIFAKLKKNSEVYNLQERTFGDFAKRVRRNGVGRTLSDSAMWGQMRMSPTDIADVTGSTYTYLINGHSTADNWNAIYRVGERIRLRIINASAMTIFNFRIPDLPMTVVASDGLNVKPLETDEFQIGVAETYDVIVRPKAQGPFALVAEAIDRSGMAVATLAAKPGAKAFAPPLRERPTLTMRDMGMAHNGHHGSGHGAHGNAHAKKEPMDHGAMGHSMAEHHDMASHAGQHEEMHSQGHNHMRGPGVDMINEAPVFRLNEPGLGLENVPHRTLTYADLRSLDRNPDRRPPGREIELHLTGNMERYMWSFDGIKFSEVKEPIRFQAGERVRLTLVNDTMMSHPIHLHGMFFDVVNGDHHHKPRKHTIIVKPAEKLSVDVTAENVGDWAFHCHLLMHMHAGMMQVVSILPHAMASKPSEKGAPGERTNGSHAHRAPTKSVNETGSAHNTPDHTSHH